MSQPPAVGTNRLRCYTLATFRTRHGLGANGLYYWYSFSSVELLTGSLGSW